MSNRKRAWWILTRTVKGLLVAQILALMVMVVAVWIADVVPYVSLAMGVAATAVAIKASERGLALQDLLEKVEGEDVNEI